MTDKAKAFAEKVSADEDLKMKLTAALEGLENAEQVPTIIEFANNNGIELTREDLIDENEDLSLDELETVTGGGSMYCWCFSGSYEDEMRCACTIAGEGWIGGEGHGPKVCDCAWTGEGSC